MNKKFNEIIEKIKVDKKLALIVMLSFIGIVLLVISEFLPEEEKIEEDEVNVNELSFSEYEKSLEDRLEELLVCVNGAGKVKVMVTVESTDEKIYATESFISDANEEKNYVLIDVEGSDSGLLLKIAQPEVRGVAVVCEGADLPSVRQEITGTITSVLGISTNRVNISKMKSETGG